MTTYSVASLADSDQRLIAHYTLQVWGTVQAKRCVQGLRECFQLLATNPLLGRPCDFLVRGLRRFEHGKHVVFYVLAADGVLVARVLHQQMVPEKEQFDAGAA